MAQTYQPLLVTTIPAVEAIAKNLFVDYGGNIADDGERALGVSEVGVNALEPCPVIVEGIALVLAGGNISAGGLVMSSAAGKAIAATGTGKVPNGVAIDAGADGVLIRVHLGTFNALA